MTRSLRIFSSQVSYTAMENITQMKNYQYKLKSRDFAPYDVIIRIFLFLTSYDRTGNDLQYFFNK